MNKQLVYINFFEMVVVKQFITILLAFSLTIASGDEPCAARSIPNQSVVCVCNSTYCDTVTRDPPASGTYVAYTSSKDGLRFNKTTGPLITYENLENYPVTIQLDPSRMFQTIEGFGGAATDAAGINWKNLSEPLQKYLVDSYFSENGLQYNMLRVPIGGTDFSTHPYAYDEQSIGDTELKNFSLSYEDFEYKMPLIKAGMQVSKTPIHILSTTWSPPAWMKTNNAISGRNRLKPIYYQTFAEYIYKFIEKYSANGIPIWGITTTNEPTDGFIGLVNFNSLGWTAETMGDWIINNLGPTIRNSIFKDTKIFAVDDQRLFLYYWWNKMIAMRPKVLDYVDGAAVHYYSDFAVPVSVQDNAMKPFPTKMLINSEACTGSYPWEEKVVLGSWARANEYVSDIITNLNHNSIGWLDWNLCLNAGGGPNWAKNFVDSPIIVFPERDEFYKQPMFYAMGHFSKFIPRGSIRIHRTMHKSILTSFQSVAVLTPENTVVVVLYNKGSARTVNIKLGNQLASVNSPAAAVVTVELPYEQFDLPETELLDMSSE